MTEWILSVVGIVFLGVMVDVISPIGKTNAFIKGIFSLFLIYVLITPIINKIESTNVSKIDFELDNNLLDTVTNQKIEVYRIELLNILLENNYSGLDVEIEGNMSNGNFEITKIIIIDKSKVLLENNSHINNYKNITTLIVARFQVKEEVIVFE